MTLMSSVLIGNESTYTLRFLTQVTEEENIQLSSVLLRSHRGILKTCYYIYYSMIHFVLNLPRGLAYVEIFYIGIVMGEDRPTSYCRYKVS